MHLQTGRFLEKGRNCKASMGVTNGNGNYIASCRGIPVQSSLICFSSSLTLHDKINWQPGHIPRLSKGPCFRICNCLAQGRRSKALTLSRVTSMRVAAS